MIARGTRFVSKYEQRCIALSAPDRRRGFRAVTAEGIVARFSLPMVGEITGRVKL